MRRQLLRTCIVVFLAVVAVPIWNVIKHPLVALPYFCVALSYYGDRSIIEGCQDMLYIMNIAGGKFAKPLSKAQPKVDPDDHVGKVCKTSLFLKTPEEPTQAYQIFDVDNRVERLSTNERLQAYLEACAEVYAKLAKDGKQRKVLDGMVDFPETEVENVTQAFLHGPWKESDRPAFVEKRDRALRSMPSLEPRWKSAEEYQELGPKMQQCRSHGICPVKEDWVAAKDIDAAIRRGQVALFDAKELLPSEFFNLTLDKLAAMHSESRVPMLRNGHHAVNYGHEPLADLAKRMDAYSKKGLTWLPHLKPWADASDVEETARRFKNAEPSWLSWCSTVANFLLSRDVHTDIQFILSMLMTLFVSVPRMPEFPKVDLKQKLGSEWIEHIWSNVWVGPTIGNFHFDEADNILISLHGVTYATVYLQPDIHVIAETRHPNLVGLHNPTDLNWIKDPNNTWAQKFPFVTVKLEPGTGIIIPSRCYHWIHAPDAHRMLYNVWMLEKYESALLDEPTGKYRFGKRGSQADIYMALRHLKFSTAFHLWETRKVGGFFQGNLEIL